MHKASIFACTIGHCTLDCTNLNRDICAKVSADLCLIWYCWPDCVNLHQVLVEQLLQRVWDKGDIYKAKYEGDYTCNYLMNNKVYINF